MTFSLATTVDDTFRACNPDEPLRAGDSRYTDLSRAREGAFNTISSIKRTIIRSENTYYKFVVGGHRGCGKSTELLKLQQELNDYCCVYFDVEDKLDLADISYIDIFVGMIESIEQKTKELNIQIDDSHLNAISKWLYQSIEKEETSGSSSQGSISAEVSVGAKIPFYASLMAKFLAEMKYNANNRLIVRTQIEKRASEFISLINNFFIDVRKCVQENGLNDFVIIADGLEKLLYRADSNGDTHTQLFIKNAEQLKAPLCHIVYTMPINLVYIKNIQSDFENMHILPMVKVTDKEGKEYDQGIESLMQLIKNRIDVDKVYQNPDKLKELITISGGVTRDLMRLIRMTTDTDDNMLTDIHIKNAVSELSKRYDPLVKTADIAILKSVYNNKRISLDNQRVNELLLNRIILEYENGERFATIHPAVMNVSWIREAIINE